MSNTVLVQNELLAFAFDSLNADHRDCTEQIIDKFYDDSAVKDAKKLIWQEYVNSLPQWQKRRVTSTSAKTKDIGDIMSAVSTMDQKFSNKDELPVTFAAVKLSNVPNKQIREEPNILNRLQTLELQMKDVIADRRSYAAATRAHINDMTPTTGAAPKSDGGLLNGAAGYRGISLFYRICKLYDYAIIDICGDSLDTCDMQYGFKKKAFHYFVHCCFKRTFSAL